MNVFRESQLPQNGWRILTIFFVLLALLFGATGLGYGVPNRERIKSLLGNIRYEPALTKTMFSERDYCHEQVQSQRSHHGKTFTQQVVDNTCGLSASGEISDVEKSAAFRSHLLRGGWNDEGHTFGPLSHMRPSEFNFHPSEFLYGGAYIYPTGALIFLADKLGIAPIERNSEAFVSNPEGVANIYRAGRSLGLITTLLTLALLIVLALRWGDWRAAALTIGFYAFTDLTWSLSHIAKPHGMAVFWSVLCFYLLSRAHRDDRLRWVILAGTTAGLAIGSALSCGLLVFAFPVMLFKRGKIRSLMQKLIVAGTFCVLAFLVTNPYAIIDYGGFLYAFWEFGVGYDRVIPTPAILLKGIENAAKIAPTWLTLPGLIGVIYMMRQHQSDLKCLSISTVLVGICTIGIIGETRFVLFCLWLLPLGFGLLFSRLAQKLTPGKQALSGIVFIALIVPSIITTGFASRLVLSERDRPHAIDTWARSINFDSITVATVGNHFAPAPAYPVHRARTINLAGLNCAPVIPDWLFLPHPDSTGWASAAVLAGFKVNTVLPGIEPANPFKILGLSSNFKIEGFKVFQRIKQTSRLCLN